MDDDSSDSTAAAARQLAQRNPRVRVIQRIGRRGLASAAVEGMLASSAPYLAVMDCALQHDESILPAMPAKLQHSSLDLVAATRFTEGGMDAMPPHRRALSSMGRRLNHIELAAAVQTGPEANRGFPPVSRDGGPRLPDRAGF